MREKRNKYDIREIKATLKEKKKDQEGRIATMREARLRIKEIDLAFEKIDGCRLKSEN